VLSSARLLLVVTLVDLILIPSLRIMLSQGRFSCFIAAILLLMTPVQGKVTSMKGAHVRLVTVHEPPYMDVGLNDGRIAPVEEWKGMLIDMLNQISQRGNFTYDLSLPSGRGPSCVGDTNASWARQYKCAQEDVLTLNVSDAYWALTYITTQRIEDGTLFAPAYLTDQGLGILTTAKGPTLLDQMLVIFKPFSPLLWVITALLILFVGFNVYLKEVFRKPYERAEALARETADTTTKREIKFYEDSVKSVAAAGGTPVGLVDPQGFIKKYTNIVAGTFGGLMSAAEMEEDEDDDVNKPSGPSAIGWLFFSLLWVSAFTANLAASLTVANMQPKVESLDEINRHQMTVCVKLGTAYAEELTKVYGMMKFRAEPDVRSMVFALEDGKCDAAIDTSSVLLAVSNGAVDLDYSEGKNFCDVKSKLLMAGEPSRDGLTDMAIGVGSHDIEFGSKLQEVLSWWVTKYRTCSDRLPSSLCYEGGTGGHSIEWLREYHVDLENCDADHTDSDSGAKQLTVENFILPICMVVLTSLASMLITFQKYIRKVIPYQDGPRLDQVIKQVCVKEPGLIRHLANLDMEAFMIDELVGILRTSLLTDKRQLHAFIRASLKYFVANDMSLFFLLLKTGEVLLPPLKAGTSGFASYCDSSIELKNQFQDMQAQGKSKEEALNIVQILIIQAIKMFYEEHNTLQDYTFVCRSETHLAMLKNIVNPETRTKSCLDAIYSTFVNDTNGKEPTTRETLCIGDLPEGFDEGSVSDRLIRVLSARTFKSTLGLPHDGGSSTPNIPPPRHVRAAIDNDAAPRRVETWIARTPV